MKRVLLSDEKMVAAPGGTSAATPTYFTCSLTESTGFAVQVRIMNFTNNGGTAPKVVLSFEASNDGQNWDTLALRKYNSSAGSYDIVEALEYTTSHGEGAADIVFWGDTDMARAWFRYFRVKATPQDGVSATVSVVIVGG